MPDFTPNQAADVNGTYNIGKILVPPKRMVELFGRPREVDGYKVSGSYTFTDERGNVFTVYDWKVTSLYFDAFEDGQESSLPSPEEFWDLETPEELMVGGKDGFDVASFKRWLLQLVE